MFDLDDIEATSEVINGITSVQELREGMLILARLRKAYSEETALLKETIANLEEQVANYKIGLSSAQNIIEMVKTSPHLAFEL